jgi:hypothetical protein
MNMLYIEDTQLQRDVTWFFSYVCQGEEELLEIFNNPQFFDKMVDLVGHEESDTFTPALRLIGNFLSSNNDHVDEFIKRPNFFENISKLLSDPKAIVRKEAAWCCSNMTAGTECQVDAVVRSVVFYKLLTGMSDKN